MSKYTKGILVFSLGVVAVCTGLIGTHQLSANSEHWCALLLGGFGGLAHFLPSVMGQSSEALADSAADKAVQK